MHFAIIAAGEGSRLASEGIALPKPLVRLRGEALIDRLMRIFMDNGPTMIHVIINEQMTGLRTHLGAKQLSVPLNIVVKTTQGSLHSFASLLPHIDGGVCLATVDAVFNEEEFAAYIQDFKADAQHDGLAAVTTYIDDEKPLYVSADEALNIQAFTDKPEAIGVQYVSGGVYCLNPKTFASARSTLAAGQSRMRDFQRRMLTDGHKIKAWNFSKIIDVDHASDIEKAEQLLRAPPIA